MKVALCLSGQPRFYQSGYKQIKTYLIDRYNIKDIFCHFWWDPKTNDQGGLASWNIERYGSKSYINNNNILKDLNKLYSPKIINYNFPKSNTGISLENLVKYKTEYITKHEKGEVFEFKDYAPEYQTWAYNHLKSIFESIYLTKCYKKSYEDSLNQKYDLIIKTRYDIGFRKGENFPSIETIKSLLNQDLRNYYRDWDNLWIYDNKVYDLVIDKIWNDFDNLFNYITSPYFINPYPFVRLKASPEHMYWASLMQLGFFDRFDNISYTEHFICNN